VEALICSPETAALPDREIARRVGVSPSTVSSIRRRLAHPQGNLFGTGR
jgi:DNA-binding CsgD family transcriptional regulator